LVWPTSGPTCRHHECPPRSCLRVAIEHNRATAADLEIARLSLHAELALDYIELRSADAQQRLLDDTVKAYTDALRVTQNRLDGGFAPASDVAQAKTQLDTTRVQDTDIGVMRAQYEHAIAVLVGKPPAAFSLSPTQLDLQPPPIAAGIPSELLQPRPDIAAADWTVTRHHLRA
jgi:outer membrane protein TolC